MPRLSRRLPIGRISTAQAEHHVLRRRQRNIVSEEFECQDGDVDLEKEIKVDMRNTEIERLASGVSCTRTVAMSDRRKTLIGLSAQMDPESFPRPLPYRKRCTGGRNVTNSL